MVSDITIQTKEVLNKVINFVDDSPWSDKYSPILYKRLYNLDLPCELAIAGRVKAGKSSFINSLLEEHLAVVDATEATATINVFRYGNPKDSEHPVKVIYKNGQEEWQTRLFLDSLQGNTEEVLLRANEIDHLEYFLPHKILESITLVDTPGTGSVVCEHNNRLADYLTQQNIEKSNNLKQKADAVIVLVGHVQSMGDEETVRMFTDTSNPFNFIGVMSKIDNEFKPDDDISLRDELDKWNKRCTSYSIKLHDRLHSIQPVSVLLYDRVKTLYYSGELATIQKTIHELPKEYFEEMISNSIYFKEKNELLEEDFEKFGLDLSTRKSLVKKFGEFMVLKVVLSEIYNHTLDEAVKNLLEFSGMDSLRNILETQFFSRSRVMRCYATLQECKRILKDILYYKLNILSKTTSYREPILEWIGHSDLGFVSDKDLRKEIRDLITSLIDKHFYSKEDFRNIHVTGQNLLMEVESLMEVLGDSSYKSEGLLLLEQYKELFTSPEIKDLEFIFGRDKNNNSSIGISEIINLKSYWMLRREMCSPSQDGLFRKKIIELALDSIDRLIDKIN